MVLAWATPAAQDEIKHTDITQFTDFLSGARDQVATLTGYTGAGVGLKLRASHPLATPIQVRNAGDTLTTFEINNSTGILLGGLQNGSVAAPAVAFLAQPGLGLFRIGTSLLGIATGDPTRSTVTIGEGAPGSGTGIASVYQGGAAAGTTLLAQPGLSVHQGNGTALADSRDCPGLDLASYVDTRDGQSGNISGQATTTAAKGLGGFVTGFNITAQAGGSYGVNTASVPYTTATTAIAKAVIGSRVVAEAGHVLISDGASGTVSGGIRSATPLLVTSRGYNAGDQVQGMEITVSSGSRNPTGTGPATGLLIPSQRIGVIISTEDNAYAGRGTSIDACLLITRKGNAALNDQTAVAPWLSVLALGDQAGDLASWPLMADGAVIRTDPSLPAHAIHELGSVVELNNTAVRTSIMRGGTGTPPNLFAFDGINPTGSILRVGTGPKLDILGSGYIGIGTTPAVPLHIVDNVGSIALAVRGTGLLRTSSLAVPGTAAQGLKVSYWNGSAYVAGWVPIFP